MDLATLLKTKPELVYGGAGVVVIGAGLMAGRKRKAAAAASAEATAGGPRTAIVPASVFAPTALDMRQAIDDALRAIDGGPQWTPPPPGDTTSATTNQGGNSTTVRHVASVEDAGSIDTTAPTTGGGGPVDTGPVTSVETVGSTQLPGYDGTTPAPMQSAPVTGIFGQQFIPGQGPADPAAPAFLPYTPGAQITPGYVIATSSNPEASSWWGGTPPAPGQPSYGLIRGDRMIPA